jgi:predicted small secreted protein
MKMKKIKLTAVILTVVVALALISACNSGGAEAT